MIALTVFHLPYFLSAFVVPFNIIFVVALAIAGVRTLPRNDARSRFTLAVMLVLAAATLVRAEDVVICSDCGIFNCRYLEPYSYWWYFWNCGG